MTIKASDASTGSSLSPSCSRRARKVGALPLPRNLGRTVEVHAERRPARRLRAEPPANSSHCRRFAADHPTSATAASRGNARNSTSRMFLTVSDQSGASTPRMALSARPATRARIPVVRAAHDHARPMSGRRRRLRRTSCRGTHCWRATGSPSRPAQRPPARLRAPVLHDRRRQQLRGGDLVPADHLLAVR